MASNALYAFASTPASGGKQIDWYLADGNAAARSVQLSDKPEKWLHTDLEGHTVGQSLQAKSGFAHYTADGQMIESTPDLQGFWNLFDFDVIAEAAAPDRVAAPMTGTRATAPKEPRKVPPAVIAAPPPRAPSPPPPPAPAQAQPPSAPVPVDTPSPPLPTRPSARLQPVAIFAALGMAGMLGAMTLLAPGVDHYFSLPSVITDHLPSLTLIGSNHSAQPVTPGPSPAAPIRSAPPPPVLVASAPIEAPTAPAPPPPEPTPLENTAVSLAPGKSDAPAPALAVPLPAPEEPKPAPAPPVAANPINDENYRKMILGYWHGARHVQCYDAAGGFALDPEPQEELRGRWWIENNVLHTVWGSGANREMSREIVSISPTSLMTRDDDGELYTLTRIDGPPGGITPSRDDTPKNAPSAPPTPPGTSADDILSFLNNHHALVNDHDLRKLVNDYDAHVDYLDEGQVTPVKIFELELPYHRKWTSIHETVLNPEISKISEGIWRAQYNLEVHLRSAAGQSRDVQASVEMRIKETSRGLRIFSQKAVVHE